MSQGELKYMAHYPILVLRGAVRWGVGGAATRDEPSQARSRHGHGFTPGHGQGCVA